MFAPLDHWLEEQQKAGDKREELLSLLCKIQPRLLQEEYCICRGHKILMHRDTKAPRVLYLLRVLDAPLAG